MILTVPITLAAENWRTLSSQERIQALQQAEGTLATQEGRAASIIEPMRAIDALSPTGSSVPRGRQNVDEQGLSHIEINPALIEANEPYQAVETYFHEARHAYQRAAIADPQMHDNPAEVDLWAKNQAETNSYIRPERSFPLYRSQPVEVDANNVARARTEEVYSQQFTEQPNYDEYRAGKQQEKLEYIEQAEIALGPQYEEVAAQEVVDRFEQYQKELKVDEQISERASAGKQAAPAPREDKEQGEEFGQGYGF